MYEDVLIFLQKKLINQYGEEIFNKIIKGYTDNRKTTFRANSLKSTTEEIKEILEQNNIQYTGVSWSKEALIMENATEEQIRKLNIYKDGKIYLQSLSSMIPAIILDPKQDENILDMTAAPGGKTTQLVALSENKAFVTACEKNKIRLDRLKFNLDKQGATRVNVMNEDARKLDDFFSFDKILLDAPCSGSGTVNFFDKNIENRFTEDLINRSVKTQKELLKKASKILKKGGELVYSTCSILEEENENNLINLMSSNNFEILPIDKKLFEGVPLLPVKIDGTICVCPNESYEGFFVAKLRKK